MPVDEIGEQNGPPARPVPAGEPGSPTWLRRRRFLQATGAGLLAAALPATGAGTSAAAVAATADLGPEPPLMHGYSGPQIKAWDPATDRYARYLRSRVPLATRIAPFEPAQARRGLDPRPRLAVLANDYLQPGWETEGYPYGPGAEAYALRFWQYADLYASWHGLPLDGRHDEANPPYGLVNLPNPGYTDAAHRNGVLSLGCWFWPRPENFAEIVEKTPQGTFPTADKLIAMAEYFGFDGYFINQEAVIPAAQATLLMEMLRYMARKAPAGFHLQWYDSLTVDGRISYQNEFNRVNSPWVGSGSDRINTSVFLNYWWSSAKIQASRSHALSLGLDPFEVVYAGSEIGMYRFAQPYDPRAIFPEGAEPRTSWAFLGSEMVWYTVEGDKTTLAAQAPAYARERQLWSGPAEDPSRSGRTRQPDSSRPLDPAGWDGTAHHIVEKSAIGKLPFATRFCTGTGERFFVDGVQVGDRPWFDIGVQDLLPTWQWWVRDAAGAPSTAVRVDYDHAIAYDGGSSLRLSGALGPSQSATVRLYKTRLTLAPTTAVTLVHRGAGGLTLRVGLVFEDAPAQPEWLTADGVAGTGWTRWTGGLGQWSGRTVAAVAVSLVSGTAGAQGIAVNLGELQLADSAPESTPRTPSGFTVDRAVRAQDVASVYLSWDFEPDGVAHYDIFRRTAGGRKWLGRTYDGAYCLCALTRDADTATTLLELEAVSVTGRRGPAATTELSW
ncbi:endo-beta-N-acetylglucosaminidase [Streptomyces sp. NPDC002920]